MSKHKKEYENYIGKEYTFDNFDVNKKNKKAYDISQNIITKKYKQINPVFIYGKGLGKTHLLKAIQKDIGANSKVHYFTIEDFRQNFVRATKVKELDSFKKSFDQYDVLLIDDFSNISGKEATQEEIGYLIKKFILNNKQVVIASQSHIKAIAGVSLELENIIESALAVKIKQKKCKTKKLKITVEFTINDVRVKKIQ